MIARCTAMLARVAAVTRRRPAWAWLFTRAVAVAVFLTPYEQTVKNDVAYYWQSLRAMVGGVPLADTLREYPVPALATMFPQYVASDGRRGLFEVIFLVSMLVIDAAFARRLRGGGDGLVFWIWFVPLLGPVCWLRFDMVPAVLLGAALLAVTARPSRAGFALALATGVKLWPVSILPAMLAARAGRARALQAFAVSAVLLLVVSVGLGGWARLWSPLRWQSDRGLQIESIAATPFMFARIAPGHDSWRVAFSRYQAHEISGAGTGAALTLATAATVLAAALVLVLVWRLWRAPLVNGVPAAWVTVATVLLVIITNKTLSPQYLLWLAAPVAVLASDLVGRVGQAERAQHTNALRLQMFGLLVLAALTQLEYPLLYPAFDGGSRLPVVTLILVVRNVGLVLLTASALRQAWRETGRPVEQTSYLTPSHPRTADLPPRA